MDAPETAWTSTRDGVRLGVRRWAPVTATGTAIVVAPGFGATKDSPTVGRVADALAGDGHEVLSYTARGHGESGGLCTLGDDERHDVEAVVGLARGTADRVIVVGASMGAIAVLRHAAADSPDGVVTVSSPAEWSLPRTAQSAGAAVLTQTGAGRWLARRALRVRLATEWTDADPPVALAERTEVPLAVIHGRRDRFIKVQEAHKLHAAAAGPSRIDLVEGMGHAYVTESVPAVRDAVRWALAVSVPVDASTV